MNLTLTSKIKITGLSPDELSCLVDECRHTNPAYGEALKHGRSVRHIDKTIDLSSWQDGALTVPIGLLDRVVELYQGEFLIVPRGVEHRPVAEKEVQVLLFEPASTLNTGNVINERTVEQLKRI